MSKQKWNKSHNKEDKRIKLNEMKNERYKKKWTKKWARNERCVRNRQVPFDKIEKNDKKEKRKR